MLKVDTNKLDEVSADIRNSAREIGYALDRLERDLRALEQRWDGTSSTAFTTTRHRWGTHAEAMRTSLERITTLLDKTTKTYVAVENANINTWS